MKFLQVNNYALAQLENSVFELSDVTEALARLETLNCHGAILDFRKMLDDLSRTESFLVALRLQELENLRSHKIGLVCNGSGPGIRQIAEYARSRGLSVQTFNELDGATAWLET